MADDPAEGVVDRECQVHGVRGLFVAGSSVFPTSGHCNPTQMIVALAIRLADRLKLRFFGHDQITPDQDFVEPLSRATVPAPPQTRVTSV